MASSFYIFMMFLATVFGLPNELISRSNFPSDSSSKLKNSKINCVDFSTADSKSLEACFQEIKKQNWPKNESNLHLKLLCIQNRPHMYGKKSAIVAWTNDKPNTKLAFQIISNADQSNGIIYELVTPKEYFKLETPDAVKEYQILVLRQSLSKEIALDDVAELNFLVPENVTVPQISWYNFTDFSPIDETRTNATFKWNSSNDGVPPCYFELWWVTKGEYYTNKKKSTQPAVQEDVIPNLSFSKNYTMSMFVHEKKVKNFSLKVPSCRQIAAMRNSSCSAISKIEKIRIYPHDNVTNASNCSITIQWTYDDVQPDYFNVTIKLRVSSLPSYSYYDSKFVTKGNNLTLNIPYEVFFLVTVTAHIGNISSDPTSQEFESRSAPKIPMNELISSNQSNRNSFIVPGAISIVVVLLILSAVSLFLHYKRKTAVDADNLGKIYDNLLITNTEPILLNNEIEEKPKEMQKLKLLVGKMLGKGNFGIVHLGTLIINGRKLTDVAIKTLQGNATAKDIEQFQKEIELMENVGFHLNIVSIIGSCPDVRRPLLIVEYCPLGDLHTYLCNIKKTLENCVDCDPAARIQYQNLEPIGNESNSKHLVHNKIYGVNKNIVVPQLTICDLLSFGRQVATGMDYLASNRVIHRDLAARNVLLCNNGTAKISDFGLSRDIYAENIYCKVKGEIMPIKWMAPESLSRGEYSTSSDVWSFGVFLWELLTIGDEPYPDVVVTFPDMFVLLLKDGYRMPDPCPSHPQLYEIMLLCWQEERELRPEFSTLRYSLDEILRKCSPHQYIAVTGSED